MANTILTISKITNEALMVLENELVFTKQVNRAYEDQFGIVGAKIGSTVNVRRPARFVGNTGPALNVEDFNEGSIPVTLTTQFHVDTQFTTQDLALSLDAFSERVLKPAIAAIANKVDFDGTTTAANGIANIVGVPGTTPTSLSTFLNAGAYLDAEGAPRDGRRSVTIEPFTGASMVDALKGLLAPADKIGEQYKKGLMGRDTAGLNWFQDQNIVSHTFGTYTSTAGILTMSGANQGLATGWASTSSITVIATQAATINAGDTIQIAGVYAVNPQNRQAYGSSKLRNFVVTATVSLAQATAATLVVSPALIYGGQFQNVTATPATNATITPLSLPLTTAVVSPQNLLIHRDCLTLAVADLELPDGVHFAGRASDEEIGLSIRVVRQYTINNDAIPCRLDVLYGWAMLYPELGCRVAG